MIYEYLTIRCFVREISDVLSTWGRSGWHVIHVQSLGSKTMFESEGVYLFILERKRDLQGEVQ